MGRSGMLSLLYGAGEWPDLHVNLGFLDLDVKKIDEGTERETPQYSILGLPQNFPKPQLPDTSVIGYHLERVLGAGDYA